MRNNHNRNERFRRRDDPTPREIIQRCLAIQAGWTRTERMKRITTKLPPWLPPIVDGGFISETYTEEYQE